MEKCEIKHCRNPRSMGYYDHGICQQCWEKSCRGEIDLKKEFDIKGWD